MNILSTGYYKENITYSIAQFELMIGLKKKGINIIIVAKFSEEILKKFKMANIHCIEDFPDSKIDFKYIERMKQYIDTYEIDIIHAFRGIILRNMVIAVKKSPVKLIAYMGSTSLHWHDPSAYFTYLSKRVDKIICISKSIQQHVKNQLFGKKKEKAIKIVKGYNPNWFNEITPYDYSELGINRNTKIICLAANYLKVKGIEYYIKSTYYIDKNIDAHFILLGDMRDNKTVPKLIENSPLKDKIHALGSRTDIISFLKGADVYVQTSNNEGLGRAIIEAMCCEKPIIMTNAGGCTELIDKSSGIIVPRKNPKAIAEAIVKLVNDEKLRKSMGQNALSRIENHIHVDNTIEQTIDLYKTLYKQLNK
tara:strand:+ start:34876 stop:35970 length:1095 start_codon:yes stop_codon:yes gene_type:complete